MAVLIADLRAAGNSLTNHRGGGEGGMMDAVTRAKLRAAFIGKPLSLEHCANISAAHKGQAPWNKGVSPSEETLAKLRGRTLSDKHRASLRAGRAGRVFSTETRAKMSASHKGHEVSVETRAKISATKRQREMAR